MNRCEDIVITLYKNNLASISHLMNNLTVLRVYV